jgi:hypothetical protein
MRLLSMKHWGLLSISLCFAACMAESRSKTQADISALSPPHASLPAMPVTNSISWEHDVKPVLDRRCVVCHSCYDAPCQVQLTSFEGSDRGATKAVVYDGGRLTAADPTRLFVDAKSTQAWRERDFFSILHADADHARAASIMQRMLELGRANPVPANTELPESVDLDIDRKLACAKASEFDDYAASHPFGGMPYGLAPMSDTEYTTLLSWLRGGAPAPATTPAPSRTALATVRKWEDFFNGSSAKQRVTSRYIYEHLFLAHLYFLDAEPGRYFRLVRSRTPSGQEIDEIASVRPYDPPGVDTFFYRLRPVTTTIVDKTHMAYALSDAKMARYRELFLAPTWVSETIPTYDGKASANAFVTFENVPARARYQFLLDDAGFFIMTFIKGPVCRGQIALNVIEDHFFVAFLDPDSDLSITDPQYLVEAKSWLKLPAENKSRYTLGGLWLKYLVKWRDYVKYRAKRYRENDPQNLGPSLDDIWDGDGTNDNALLTVFRHFDSATVVKGYVGNIPKTAWVVDYPILERIYYDLVAGFSVYGNVVHQLSTRLYMDYLRMESEDLFLSFLPSDAREATRDSWYVGAGAETKAFLENRLTNLDIETRVAYQTAEPKRELIDDILGRMKPAVRGGPDTINRCTRTPCPRNGASADARRVEAELQSLASVTGAFVEQTPDLSLLRVRVDNSGKRDLAYTLVHNKDHYNVAFMFGENDRRNPAADTMTIVPGYLGSYPNFFFDVKIDDIDDFVAQMKTIRTDEDFTKLAETYGVRRSSPRFWATNDWLQTNLARTTPIGAGMLDLNRYDDY